MSYFSNGEEGDEVSEEQTDNDDKINCAIINDRHPINEHQPTSCSNTKPSSLQSDGQEDTPADNNNDGIDKAKISQEGHLTVDNDNAAPVSTGQEIDAPISSDEDDIATTQSDNDNAVININNNNDDDGDDNVAAVELKAISSSTIDANNKNCEFEIVLDSWEWSFGGSTAKI